MAQNTASLGGMAPESQETTSTPSRIFIRNLPPTITEADFASHIHRHRPNAITDVRLLPRRRIAYVGYKSSEDALAAVKYFNKSFIRMSRIYVELARDIPKDQTQTSRASQSEPSAVTAKHETERGTRPKKDTEAANVGKAAKRSWEDAVSGHGGQPPNANVNGDGTLLSGSKKLRIDSDAVEATAHSHPSGSDTAHGQLAEAEDLPKSDLDWMRSRTSRLLEQMDDENGPGDRTGATEEPTQQPTPPADADTGVSNEVEAEESATEQPGDQDVENIQKGGRLFLRNLSYEVNDFILSDLFATYGKVQEVHVPIDSKSGKAKGIAFVQFENPNDAVHAFKALDGVSFQGRLLHVIPGAAKRETQMNEYEVSKLPLKQQKLLQRKSNSANNTFNWNALYMSADAVVSSIASRLGIPKSEVIDPTSSDAAVKQAQAETHVINETKQYFEKQGIDLDSFSSRQREDNPILVKNFPYGTSSSEMVDLFQEFGSVSRVLMPPAGTIAIVEFAQKNDAKSAFKALAYRRFKETILYLEKAPKALFKSGVTPASHSLPSDIQIREQAVGQKPKTSTADLMAADDVSFETSTLFVRNLNFATTNHRLHDVFKPLDGFLSAKVMTKSDPKKPGQSLSMGYGFVEFRTKEQAQAAQEAMDNHNLDGHQLQIKASHKGHDAAEQQRREDKAKRMKERKAKLIIKNLPFQATKKDVRSLLGTYGQLKSVRVPKKFDNSRKGFAFAEFTTPKEAESAMESLRDTHFLGRRLVIDYAAGEIEDPEKELERLQQKVGKQANTVALQKLTASSERRKFIVHGNGEEDDGTA